MSIWLIILIIIAVVVLLLITLYNGLIKANTRVEEALSDITVQMKRRFDLIPNLIETVKGYAKHESETFNQVIEARNKAMQGMQSSQTPDQLDSNNNMLSSTLKSLFALAESYPDLKANQNYLELQRELTDTEDKILASRRFYNGATRDFNIKIAVFPANIFSSMLGFKAKEFFKVENEEEISNPVKVTF